ncbi:MAG: biotin-dependent carboxyltransferase family protein [Acidobacteriota bacterium]
MAELLVIKPGLLTTVQDRGRWGFQSRGVSVAGPMDAYSHRLVNALVGNGDDAATLEVTAVGPLLEFDDERLIAVSGAEFDADLDGRRVAPDQPCAAGPGSRLAFGSRRRGTRAYVAVAGGIAVAPVFGSRATHVGSRLGGFDGRPLRTGDRLPLGLKWERTPFQGSGPRTLLRQARPVPHGHAVVRVLVGPQADYFTGEALAALQASPYSIGQSSDRMGFRLEGTRLGHLRGADIISDATPMGAIQVPASGLPILLMADRQTTGGYPKIATVITADLGLAGQLGPGDTLSFAVCSPGEALAALIAQERALMAIERPEVA